MTSETLEALGVSIDEAFFLLGAAILLIEIAKGLLTGSMKGRTFLDMVASISTQIPALAIEIGLLFSGYLLFSLLADSLVTWTLPLDTWVIVAGVVAADFVYYWEHRIAHQVRVLWTQHAVHHSSRYMNITTSIRFGPLESVWSLACHLPLVFLGFPPEVIFFGIIVVLAYQTWIHTELVGQLGPIEGILNTPANHRVHHGCDAKYVDRNYGGIFIVWDRLFGTYQREEETPRYGLVRDFDSVNPLRVWFSELPGLFRDLRKARSMSDVWTCLMAPPGTYPPSTHSGPNQTTPGTAQRGAQVAIPDKAP
ncbi:sterol desaturase family protein [Pyruvatibacter sp.]|uniref:sterol desaturase family protein n=1 Tax=Pyruvatibacter sp. TaxID=1981328 RepID=UPI00326721CD